MTKLCISILVVLLGYIHGSCVLTNPNSSTDCTSLSDSSNYCCIIFSPGYAPTTQSCIQVAKNNFFGQNIYFDVNNESWRLNCGSNAVAVVNAGGQCGNPKPLWAVDCWSFSTLHNSCCYYLSGNSTGTPGCQWYPEKLSGNGLNPQTNLLIQCQGSHSSVNFALLVLVALVLLIGNL